MDGLVNMNWGRDPTFRITRPIGHAGLPWKSRSACVVRDFSLPMPIVNNVERGEGLTVDLVAILLAAGDRRAS